MPLGFMDDGLEAREALYEPIEPPREDLFRLECGVTSMFRLFDDISDCGYMDVLEIF